MVAIPIIVFCELYWVLRKVYRFSSKDVAGVIAGYLAADTVVTDRPAAEDGLAFVAAGGDFADGAIAHLGRAAGGEVFATFDIAARKLAAARGHKVVEPLA